MKTIIDLETLQQGATSPDAIAIFGGTFDPPHEGHVSIITRLLLHFRTVVVAPTAQNPWKTDRATDLELRLQMLQLVLRYEHLSETTSLDEDGVYLSEFPYSYAVDFLSFIRSKSAAPLYWAIADESKEDVSKWKDWEKDGVPVVTLPVTVDIHGTRIRKGLQPIHPGLRTFAEKYNLYAR